MTLWRRLENRIWPVLLRFNLAALEIVMLAVRGRKTAAGQKPAAISSLNRLKAGLPLDGNLRSLIIRNSSIGGA